MMALMPVISYGQTTYNQPTTFSIVNAYAYQNVLEMGDQFFIVQYNLAYAVAADAPSSVGECYLGSILYSGVAVGTVQPVSYFRTVGAGVDSQWFYSVYFSSDDVTSLGLDWSVPANYSVSMVGNPTLTWAGGTPPAPANGSMTTFTSSTTLTESQETLATKVRVLAGQYQTLWGYTPQLTQEIGGVLKLTSSGEVYFTQSIVSLRQIAPGVFADSLSTANMDNTKLVADYYVDVADTDIQVYGVNWAAQTWLATDSYDISGFEMRMFRVGLPGTITGTLRDVTADLPSGADLATGTIEGDDITTYDKGEWYKIVFTTNYTLTSGHTYALVIEASGGDVGNYVVVRDVTNATIGPSSTGSYSLVVGDPTGTILAIGTGGAGGSVVVGGSVYVTYAFGSRCSSTDSGATWTKFSDSIMFTILSIDGASGAYQAKLAAHLDETTFGVPAGGLNTLAESFGLSRNWLTTLLWFFISIGLAIVSAKAIRNNKPIMPILFLMMPIGSYAGFLPLNITIIAATISALGMVWVFGYSKSV